MLFCFIATGEDLRVAYVLQVFLTQGINLAYENPHYFTPIITHNHLRQVCLLSFQISDTFTWVCLELEIIN